jgi:hypothetical protein
LSLQPLHKLQPLEQHQKARPPLARQQLVRQQLQLRAPRVLPLVPQPLWAPLLLLLG